MGRETGSSSLKDKEKMALWTAVKSDPETAGRLTASELAEHMSLKLGFPVSKRNIETACETTGVPCKKRVAALESR